MIAFSKGWQIHTQKNIAHHEATMGIPVNSQLYFNAYGGRRRGRHYDPAQERACMPRRGPYVGSHDPLHYNSGRINSSIHHAIIISSSRHRSPPRKEHTKLLEEIRIALEPVEQRLPLPCSRVYSRRADARLTTGGAGVSRIPSERKRMIRLRIW